MSVKYVRTPDERFENLPEFPWKPHYFENIYGGLRLHYIDEVKITDKKAKVETFLCLHGEPTWSYLYRRMIPIFLKECKNVRVVVPDLIGFGKSDKLIDDSSYTFAFHRNILLEFIKKADLVNITLVCQDWGGLLGLTLPVDLPERFSRLLMMNTAFAIGANPGPGFLAWRDHSNKNPDLNVGQLIARGTPHLTKAEINAYNAPFPDITYKAGVRAFPNLVPTKPTDPGTEISKKAMLWWNQQKNIPVFIAIGMQDPVIVPAAVKKISQVFVGPKEIFQVEKAGHFVQEWGEEVAKKAIEFYDKVEKKSKL